MQQSKLLKDQQKELDKINEDFHKAIDEKGHCYDRGEEEGSETCDCAYFYKKWVDTKQKYQKLNE